MRRSYCGRLEGHPGGRVAHDQIERQRLVDGRNRVRAARRLQRLHQQLDGALALVDGVPRATNVEHYARIIKEKATLRSLIFSANKILAAAYDAEDTVGWRADAPG